MKKFLITFLALLVIGCAGLEQGGWVTPQPAKSEYFETSSGGFGISTRTTPPEFRYTLGLKVLQPFSKTVYLTVYFENPTNKNNPIIVHEELAAKKNDFYIESPSIQGLKRAQGYVIDVFVFSDPNRTQLITKHRQVVRSIIDHKRFKLKN